jgi:hypothetical protein
LRSPELIYTGKPCKRGHDAPRYAKFGGCVQCVREDNARQIRTRKAERYAANKKWCEAHPEYRTDYRRDWAAKNPERTMLNSARRTAKAKGLPFDLTVDDIVIPNECPVLGIPLLRNGTYRLENSPSLDRIIPSKGYVGGNVIVVSWRANRIKCDATVNELKAIASFYANLVVKN